MNDRRATRAGFIRLRALFWILFLSAGIYAAYMFVPPYAGFYMLKTEVEEEVRVAHMYNDEVLAQRITGKAASWSIELSPQELQIFRGSDDIRIIVDYTVTLDFFDRYSRELVYHIDVQGPLKEKGRVL